MAFLPESNASADRPSAPKHQTPGVKPTSVNRIVRGLNILFRVCLALIVGTMGWWTWSCYSDLFGDRAAARNDAAPRAAVVATEAVDALTGDGVWEFFADGWSIETGSAPAEAVAAFWSRPVEQSTNDESPGDWEKAVLDLVRAFQLPARDEAGRRIYGSETDDLRVEVVVTTTAGVERLKSARCAVRAGDKWKTFETRARPTGNFSPRGVVENLPACSGMELLAARRLNDASRRAEFLSAPLSSAELINYWRQAGCVATLTTTASDDEYREGVATLGDRHVRFLIWEPVGGAGSTILTFPASD